MQRAFTLAVTLCVGCSEAAPPTYSESPDNEIGGVGRYDQKLWIDG